MNMEKIDNIKIVRCRLFLLQIKNWIQMRYGTNTLNYYIYDFDEDIELQIQFYEKENEKEKIADEIYRYISKTFSQPEDIKLEMSKNQNRIKIIVKCKYTDD